MSNFLPRDADKKFTENFEINGISPKDKHHQKADTLGISMRAIAKQITILKESEKLRRVGSNKGCLFVVKSMLF